MRFKKELILLVLVSFLSCNSSLTTKEKENYTAKGKEIIQASFKELSGHLIRQMKMGGPAQAIPFCNVEAMPITTKMADKFNVTIKRTSDKVRNSVNNPSLRELEIIEEYKKAKINKTTLTTIVELDSNNKKHFYAPIIVNSKCLNCHGKLEGQLSVKTDSLIKYLYPNDKAIGYSGGDLRGIWSVTFND